MNKQQKEAQQQRQQRRQEKRERRKAREAENRAVNMPHVTFLDSSLSVSIPSENTSKSSLDMDYIVRLKSGAKSLRDMSKVADILQVSGLADGISTVRQLLAPEIRLKEENDHLRYTLKEMTGLIQTQKIAKLEEKCAHLEVEKESVQDEKRKNQEERKNLELERQGMESMNASRKQELDEQFESRDKTRTDELKQEKADYEKNFESKLSNLQETNESLTTANTELKKDKEKGDQKIEILTAGNNALMKTVSKLESDIQKEKSRFLLQSKGVDFYKNAFCGIQQQVEAVVLNYISGPIGEDDSKYIDADRLVEENEFFKFVPKNVSSVSLFLWKAGAQALITSSLCRMVWCEFSYQHPPHSIKSEDISSLLAVMSENYAKIQPEREEVWRTMTYQILDEMSTKSPIESRQKDFVHCILETLEPLIDPQSTDFENSLGEIFKTATDLWADVKQDSLRISISGDAPNEDSEATSNKWRSVRSPDIEDIQIPGDISIPHSYPLCLFPSVMGTERSGSATLIHPGQAMFAGCKAFALGYHEQQERDREIKKQEQEIRYGHRRRLSSNPQSPTFFNTNLFSHSKPLEE